MRLFQSQVVMEDLEPPPPFSIEREATRSMPVFLSQFRDGKTRLPTPEKVAIMELSSSFEKRRLGKHQQILTDITQRCREQEVNDLCLKLSSKVNLAITEKVGKEVTFYSTTFMGSKQRTAVIFPNVIGDMPRKHNESMHSSLRSVYERTYKHFPARRIIRQQTKFDFLRPSLPKINNNNIFMSTQSETTFGKAKLLERQRINGPIQLDHYISPKPDHLAPLVMPSLTLDSEKDGIESYFSTQKVTLGQKSKTKETLDQIQPSSTRVEQQRKPHFEENVVSNLHQMELGGGNSPPPNSEINPDQ
ncbi:hypothetical protein CHS0354_012988 [Potamilus streckersoni]|uniref:Uncharacterized protein n=1 Tax=Potamilus streckersoni TaxID=2493646 RepID=A0AAE0T7J4_9BIVA|nr:hypothetical protein CHS0354_012988 [Potamilus streckersoni]